MSIYRLFFPLSFITALWFFHRISKHFPISFVPGVIVLVVMTFVVWFFLVQVYFTVKVAITLVALAAVAVGVFRVYHLFSRRQIAGK